MALTVAGQGLRSTYSATVTLTASRSSGKRSGSICYTVSRATA